MSEYPGAEATVIEGFSGLPVHTRQDHGPSAGSVEGLLDVVQRHANAESAALEQYDSLDKASGVPTVRTPLEPEHIVFECDALQAIDLCTN